MTLRKIIVKNYILSPIYEETVLKHLTKGEDRNNLAEKWSRNFVYRTGELKELGAWRWLSNFQFRHLIANFVFSDKKGIDFGGLYGPIYGNTIIVDPHPANGDEKNLQVFANEELDYIFSSHTLEHVDDLGRELSEMYRVLKKKGKILFIVPSYTCHRWSHLQSKSHKRTFSIDIDSYTRIDKEIEKAGFKIITARYCWDNSIFIFGEK